MNRIQRITHACLVFAWIAAALGLGLPVAAASAGAEAGNPPPPHRPRGPAPVAPSLPADTSLPPAPPGCANTVVTVTNNTAQAIPDYNGVPGVMTSTIHVSTANTYLWALAVTTVMTHTYPHDLDIHLISPAGSVIILSDRLGGGRPGNVFDGTTWSDQAGLSNGHNVPVTDFPFTPGVVAPLLNPEEALSALRGQNPNGTWKLVVSDNQAEDVGVLYSWTIKIMALAQPPALVNTASDDESYVDDLLAGGSVDRALYPSVTNMPISAITVTTVITHPQPGDLNIYLVSPEGISVTLSSGNGGAHPNVFALPGNTWTDRGALDHPAVPVAEYPFADNSVPPRLAPEQALAEMDGSIGSDYYGNWTLHVHNIGALGGQLGDVSLEVQTATCLPNLAAYHTESANYPITGLPFKITLESDNLGLPATGVVMTGNLPAALTFQSINPNGWSCAAPAPGSAGGNVVCHRASEAAGAALRVDVTATAPLLPQYMPFTVTVTSAQGDTYPPDGIDTYGISAYVRSANHNPWDVELYTGALGYGAQDTFAYWGSLRLALYNGASLIGDDTVGGFHLAYAPGSHWETTTPVNFNTVNISRSLYAPAGADWIRYVDTFTNTSSSSSRKLIVDWGGRLTQIYKYVVPATSDGDQIIEPTDTWAVTMNQQNPGGPAARAPIGYAFRSPGDASYRGPVKFYASTITTPWTPTSGNDLGHQFSFTLAPNATARLAYFVYRGLTEGTPGPEDCSYYGGCVTPATGSQVALAEGTAAALAANPYFCDLSPAERAQIINWPGIVEHCVFVPLVQR